MRLAIYDKFNGVRRKVKKVYIGTSHGNELMYDEDTEYTQNEIDDIINGLTPEYDIEKNQEAKKYWNEVKEEVK